MLPFILLYLQHTINYCVVQFYAGLYHAILYGITNDAVPHYTDMFLTGQPGCCHHLVGMTFPADAK